MQKSNKNLAEYRSLQSAVAVALTPLELEIQLKENKL